MTDYLDFTPGSIVMDVGPHTPATLVYELADLDGADFTFPEGEVAVLVIAGTDVVIPAVVEQESPQIVTLTFHLPQELLATCSQLRPRPTSGHVDAVAGSTVTRVDEVRLQWRMK